MSNRLPHKRLAARQAFLLYGIKNNTTQKTHFEYVNKEKIEKPRGGICGMLASLCRLAHSDFFREEKINSNLDVFDVITGR